MSDYHVSNVEVVELADTVLRYWLTTEGDTQKCRYCHAVPTDGEHKHFCPTIIASKIKKEAILLKELDTPTDKHFDFDINF